MNIIMKKKSLLLAAIVALCCVTSFAQARKGLRINEVMVINETNFEDDYGNKEAWIELFNSNYAPLEISSVFITTDSTRPKMYPVPLGDKETRIGKRQHVVFWADGKPREALSTPASSWLPTIPTGSVSMTPTASHSSTPSPCRCSRPT